MNTRFGSLFVILLTIYIFGILIERLILRGRKYGLSPLTWFAPLWLISLWLLSIPVYKFDFPFSDTSYYYVISVHLCVVFGCIVGLSIGLPPQSGEFKHKMRRSNVKFTTVFLVLGVLGALMFAADALLSSGLSLVARLSIDSMATIKDEYADPNRVGAFGGTVTTIGYYLYGFGQVGIAVYRFSMARGLAVGTMARPLCYAFISIVAFNSIFITGGRIELVVNFIIYLLAYMPLEIDGRKAGLSLRHLFYRSSLFVLGAGFLWLAIVILSSRVGGSQNSAYMLYLVHHAYSADIFREMGDNSPTISTILLQLSYLTAPIPFLGKFVDYYSSINSQLYYGGLDFAPFLTIANRFFRFLDPDFLSAAADTRTSILENAGYFGNVWATMGRELLVDFGIYGSLIFFFVLGLIANVVRLRLWRFQTVEFAIIYVLIRLQLLWSIAHGLFHHRTFGYAFTIAVFLIIYAGLFRSGRRTKRSRI